MAHRDQLVHKVHVDHKDHKDPREQLEHKDPKDHKALAHKDHKVHVDHKDHKDHKAQLVTLALKARPALQPKLMLRIQIQILTFIQYLCRTLLQILLRMPIIRD